jgi:2-polyprenyl-6-methoxyphenol hydroxylase-like FAD-dependent oxidoreductase
MSPTDEPRSPHAPGESLDADVLVVGYGPVGQTLAGLLGRSGHRVVVLERRQGRYETPRAGHFDHEIMRIFQAMGVADDVRRIADPATLYEFLDTDGDVVARLPRDWDAPSGWDASYHFYQPELEEVLDTAVRRLPDVDLRFGAAVVDLRQADGQVTATLEDGSTVTARFAVGADGANSATRALCGIGTRDLGFRGDWLVVDVRPRPGSPEIDIPHTGQVLDPARPNHMGRVAHRYYRWEFMLVDGDDPAQMVDPARVWELLRPWVGPADADIIRQTVYQFRSIVADTFRDRSILLAGDAAHVMPPFLGQGMSSGIRDAATLAWMLDLVLDGEATETLLDSYTPTRRAHVTTFIEESVRIGTVVCETDPVVAAERLEAMRSATELPPPFAPPIVAGVLDGSALAGQLGVQPRLRTSLDTTQLADDVLGTGFTLLSLVELDDAARAAVLDLEARIGLRSVVVGPEGIPEEGAALSTWLGDAGAVAVLVRPDFYVFGSAKDLGDVPALLASLDESLSLNPAARRSPASPAGAR